MSSRSLELKPVPRTAVFQDPDYYIWGGSMVRSPDGVCHLFYSRWPRELGMPAWVTHSEVAHATAPDPLGPFEFRDVGLLPRGAEHWDGTVTHNPTVHYFDGTYYLCYTGNTGDQVVVREGLNWTHRNNQRVGVAISDSPSGPWKRKDVPLIDVGAEDDAADRLCTTNPSMTRMLDGSYLLIYKGVARKNPLPFGGPVVHLAAKSPSPAGPFVKHPDPIFTKPAEAFPAEDPCIWLEGQTYFAIVKDFNGHFTGADLSLALFWSEDGFHWRPTKHPLVSTTELTWEDGSKQKLHRLERPQVWLRDGHPAVLYCAASPDPSESHSFNVHIPLNECL